MIDLIKSYPALFILTGIILVFLVLFLCIKYSKSKPRKVEKVVSSEPPKKTEEDGEKAGAAQKQAKEEQVQQPTEEQGEEKSENQEKTQNETLKKDKRVKKAKKSVEKVFKRDEETNKTVVNDEVKSSITEEELLSKMGFVSSTKKVSKLVKLPESDPIVNEVFIEHPPEEELIPAEVKHDKDNCKYFNKSRRLSKFVEANNFDDMFAEHLSERYLNIDVSKHIDVSDDTINKLYERASKTLANSDVRLRLEDDELAGADRSTEEAYKERRMREIYAELIESKNEKEDNLEVLSINEDSLDNDIKLDSKTILVADALLKRKGRKRK